MPPPLHTSPSKIFLYKLNVSGRSFGFVSFWTILVSVGEDIKWTVKDDSFSFAPRHFVLMLVKNKHNSDCWKLSHHYSFF